MILDTSRFKRLLIWSTILYDCIHYFKCTFKIWSAQAHIKCTSYSQGMYWNVKI